MTVPVNRQPQRRAVRAAIGAGRASRTDANAGSHHIQSCAEPNRGPPVGLDRVGHDGDRRNRARSQIVASHWRTPCVTSISALSIAPPSVSDRLFSMLDQMAASDTAGRPTPPTTSSGTGENAYRITIAVAGFAEADLSIEARENTLTVKGEKKAEAKEGAEVLYRGIASRAFERRFQLADHVEVRGPAWRTGCFTSTSPARSPRARRPAPFRSAVTARLRRRSRAAPSTDERRRPHVGRPTDRSSAGVPGDGAPRFFVECRFDQSASRRTNRSTSSGSVAKLVTSRTNPPSTGTPPAIDHG